MFITAYWTAPTCCCVSHTQRFSLRPGFLILAKKHCLPSSSLPTSKVAPNLIHSPEAPLVSDPYAWPLLPFPSPHPFYLAWSLLPGKLVFKKCFLVLKSLLIPYFLPTGWNVSGPQLAFQLYLPTPYYHCTLWTPTISFSRIPELHQMLLSLNPWTWFYLETLNVLALPSLTLSAQYTGEQICMCAHIHTHKHTYLHKYTETYV